MTEIKYTKSCGGVVLNSNGGVLVINQDGLNWSLPKGRPKENEEDIETARREIHEESGIKKLELVKDLGFYERPSFDDETEMKSIHMFLFKTEENILKPLDPENPEAKWVNESQVEELLTHPKDKGFFNSIKKFL